MADTLTAIVQPMTIIDRAAEKVRNVLRNTGMDDDPAVADIIVRAVLQAIRTPSDKMVKAADAWDLHCSDHDSLWSEMVCAALYPESYAGSDEPYEGR